MPGFSVIETSPIVAPAPVLAQEMKATDAQPLLHAFDTRDTPASPGAQIVSKATWEYIDAARQRWNIPGLAVAVVAAVASGSTAAPVINGSEPPGPHHCNENPSHGLGTRWTQEVKGFGAANSAGSPVEPNVSSSCCRCVPALQVDIRARIALADEYTLFSIASNTKLLTVLAVSLLIEDGVVLADGGKLAWTTRIKEVFPEWQVRESATTDLATFQDAASMVLGMPDHVLGIRPEAPSYIIEALKHLPPTAGFRETMQYCNMGYILLHRLVELFAPEKRLDAFVQRRILDKLDMGDTYYSHHVAGATGRRAAVFIQSRADPSAVRQADWESTESPPKACMGEATPAGWYLEDDDDGLHLAGWAGLISSGNDLAKWLKELLNPRIIPKRLIDDARTAHSVFDGRPPECPELGPIMYGKGQVVGTYRGHNTASHFGNMPGHRSQIIRLPDRGIGVAVLTNGGYRNHSVALLIARRVLDDVLQLEPIDWEGRLLHELREAHNTTESMSKEPSAPTVAIDGIPGVYRRAGYPDLKIVRFNSASKEHQLWTRDLPATMSCEQKRFTFFGLMLHSLHVPVMAVTHLNGNIFQWATLFRTYAPDGSEKIVPFQLGPKRAVFADGKLGFGSNFVAVSPPHKYKGGDRMITGQPGDDGGVDIWFDKVPE